MDYDVSIIWYPVSDIGPAVTFYRDKLGLTLRDQQEEWAELEIQGLKVGLNAHEGEETPGNGGGVLALRPKGGLDAAMQELQGKGVPFTGGVSEQPWGRLATFQDPDGNELQLYEPPSS